MTDTIEDVSTEPFYKQKRRHLRKLLAKNELIDSDIRPREQKIREGETAIDEATNRHQEQTAPIQEQLTDVNSKIVNHRAAGQDVPAALDKERRKLLEKIEAANTELELVIAAHREREKRLRKEIAELQAKRDNDVYPMLLQHEHYANPILLLERFTHEQARGYVNARCERAAKMVEAATDELKSAGRLSRTAIESARARLARWQAESDAANLWRQQANDAANDCERRILEE